MRGGAWNWVLAKESGEGIRSREEIASTGKGKPSEEEDGVKDGGTQIWGGMWDWERARGPGEQHRDP